MKKIKSILIIMLFVLFPSTVFASSGSSNSNFPIGAAIRSGSDCFNIYVCFYTYAII